MSSVALGQTAAQQSGGEGGEYANFASRGVGEMGWAFIGAAITLAIVLVAALFCCCRRRSREKAKRASRRFGEADISMSAMPIVTIHASQLRTPDSIESVASTATSECSAAKPPSSAPSARSTSFATAYQAFRQASSRRGRPATAAPKPNSHPSPGAAAAGSSDDPFRQTSATPDDVEIGERLASFATATKQNKADDAHADTCTSKSAEQAPIQYAVAVGVGAEERAAATAAVGFFVDDLEYNEKTRI